MVADNPVTGALVVKASGDEAHLPDIPRPVLRALYDSVIRPRASLSVESRDVKTVTLNSLQQLHQRFEQWAGIYGPDVIGFTISVKRIRSRKSQFNSGAIYSSIETFCDEEPGQNAATDSIALQFSVISENGSTGRKENIEAELIVENLVRPFSHKSRRVPFGPSVPPFRLRIQYTDYLMARSFQSVFEDWIGSLDDFDVAHEPWIARTMTTYSHEEVFSPGLQIMNAFPIVSGLSLMLGTINASERLLGEVPGPLTAFIVGYLFGNIIFRYICSRYKVGLIPPPPFVLINSGDQKRLTEYDANVRRVRKELWAEVRAISASFVTSILSGLLLYFII